MKIYDVDDLVEGDILYNQIVLPRFHYKKNTAFGFRSVISRNVQDGFSAIEVVCIKSNMIIKTYDDYFREYTVLSEPYVMRERCMFDG